MANPASTRVPHPPSVVGPGGGGAVATARPAPGSGTVPARRRGPTRRGWQPRWGPWRGPVPEAYLGLARDYQRRTELFPGWRERLVARLGPRRGDTVIDVGCGGGWNLAALRAAVGSQGTILALEESPQLLAVAAHRVTLRGWDNVELINAPAATVELSVRADAALFAAVPQVLADPAAVLNLCGQLRPGAAVAAGGWQRPPAWLWPLRWCVSMLADPLAAEPDGLERPWLSLADRLTDLQVTEVGFGTGYLAHGHHRASVGTGVGSPIEGGGV